MGLSLICSRVFCLPWVSQLHGSLLPLLAIAPPLLHHSLTPPPHNLPHWVVGSLAKFSLKKKLNFFVLSIASSNGVLAKYIKWIWTKWIYNISLLIQYQEDTEHVRVMTYILNEFVHCSDFEILFICYWAWNCISFLIDYGHCVT